MMKINDDVWQQTKYDKQNGVFRLMGDDRTQYNQGLWLSEVEGDLFLRCLQVYKQTLEHKEVLLVDQYIATLVERLNNIQS